MDKHELFISVIERPVHLNVRQHLIKVLRKKYRYTLEELAEKLEVSHPYISKIETGKCEPSEKFLKKFIKELPLELEERRALRNPNIFKINDALKAMNFYYDERIGKEYVLEELHIEVIKISISKILNEIGSESIH